jgi:hypothetical protein
LIREVVGAACDAGSTCAQIFGQKFSTPEFVITGFETAFKAADRESRTAGPDEGVKVQTSATLFMPSGRRQARRAWMRQPA